MTTPHSQSAALASIALAYRAHASKAAVPDAPPFPKTRREYKSTVGAAVHGYLENGGRSYKNTMRRAVLEKFSDAFYRGYTEAGGEDTEDDDEKWLTDKTNEELGYVDDLFSSLKVLRDGDNFDADTEADARAEGYATTLDAVYSEGKLRGNLNVMLTWRLGETEKHCRTCSGLDGKRYSAKKWIKMGVKPREPGSTKLDCKGYNCDCFFETDDGEEYAT